MDSWLTGNHLSSMEEIAIASTTTLDTGMKYLMYFLAASVNFYSFPLKGWSENN